VIESKCHFLDFSEMTDEEGSAYGILVKKLYSVHKKVTGAERIYSLITIEGVPHFHVHFIPRMSDSPSKGLKYLTQDRSCEENDVIELVQKLREMFLS
jgi:diadenosine tetraphosphate (Ap4A) HIT family hydrolase